MHDSKFVMKMKIFSYIAGKNCKCYDGVWGGFYGMAAIFGSTVAFRFIWAKLFKYSFHLIKNTRVQLNGANVCGCYALHILWLFCLNFKTKHYYIIQFMFYVASFVRTKFQDVSTEKLIQSVEYLQSYQKLNSVVSFIWYAI